MTVDRARVMIQEWQNAQENGRANTNNVLPAVYTLQQSAVQNDSSAASNSGSHPPHQLQWQRPPRGRLKCNIDAGFSTSMNRTGIGICVRDDDGAFVLAKTLSFEVVHSVNVGEALGLYYAFEWLSDMQLDHVNFETDSKITHDAFHSRKVDDSEFGQIISACQSLFSTHFTNSRVEFIRRQANEVAHALAGEATLLASPITYFNPPRCINNIIFNEML